MPATMSRPDVEPMARTGRSAASVSTRSPAVSAVSSVPNRARTRPSAAARRAAKLIACVRCAAAPRSACRGWQTARTGRRAGAAPPTARAARRLRKVSAPGPARPAPLPAQVPLLSSPRSSARPSAAACWARSAEAATATADDSGGATASGAPPSRATCSCTATMLRRSGASCGDTAEARVPTAVRRRSVWRGAGQRRGLRRAR